MYSTSSVLIGKTLPINAHSLTLHPTFSLLIHKCTTPTSPLLFSKHCNQCLYHPPTLPTLTPPQSLWENTSYPPIPLTLRFNTHPPRKPLPIIPPSPYSLSTVFLVDVGGAPGPEDGSPLSPVQHLLQLPPLGRAEQSRKTRRRIQTDYCNIESLRYFSSCSWFTLKQLQYGLTSRPSEKTSYSS